MLKRAMLVSVSFALLSTAALANDELQVLDLVTDCRFHEVSGCWSGFGIPYMFPRYSAMNCKWSFLPDGTLTAIYENDKTKIIYTATYGVSGRDVFIVDLENKIDARIAGDVLILRDGQRATVLKRKR